MVEERKNNKDVLTRKKIISLVNDTLDDALLLGVEKNDINKILDGALNYFSKEEKQEEIEFGLKTYIKKKISQIIEKKASDKQEVINMFNKYINVRLIRANNADEAIRELSKVSNIMNNYKIFLNPDILIEILNKNNTLKSALNLVLVSKKTINDDNIESMIEMYCDMNNNNRQNASTVDESNFKYDDNFKIFMREVISYPLLEQSEEEKLLKEAKAGNISARDKLVAHNLRLVINIAKRMPCNTLTTSDLAQEGSIGLMEAIKKFDPSKNAKFSTYATWWIRQAIIRAKHQKDRTIRLPEYEQQYMKKYKKAYDEIKNEKLEDPTVEKIAKIMNITVQHAKRIAKVEDAMSLESIIAKDSKSSKSDDDSNDFISKIKDDTINIEDDYIKKSLKESIKELYKEAGLSEREILILNLHYGIETGEKLTYQSICDKLGLSRQRMEQIDQSVMLKLRRLEETRNLASYLDDPEGALIRLDGYNITNSKSKKIGDNYVAETLAKELSGMEDYISIYDWYLDYTKEEVDSAIEYLQKEYKDAIILRYGKTYEKHKRVMTQQNLNDAESRVFLVAINKLGAILANKDNLSDETLEIINKMSNVAFKSLYSYYPNNSMQEIDNAVEQLQPQDKDFLNQVFLGDYRNTNQRAKTKDMEEKSRFLKIISNLKTILNDPIGKIAKKPKPIYDYFEKEKPEDVELIISLLTESDLKILNARYGGDYKKYNEDAFISHKTKVNFYTYLLDKMNRMLEDRKKSPKRYDISEEYNKISRKSKELSQKYNLPEEQEINVLLKSDKDEENSSSTKQSVVRKKILN